MVLPPSRFTSLFIWYDHLAGVEWYLFQESRGWLTQPSFLVPA